jgi:hypothetical protein
MSVFPPRFTVNVTSVGRRQQSGRFFCAGHLSQVTGHFTFSPVDEIHLNINSCRRVHFERLRFRANGFHVGRRSGSWAGQKQRRPTFGDHGQLRAKREREMVIRPLA